MRVRAPQDFLGGLSGVDSSSGADDANRAGDYAELQVGPAFTQMQTFDLPANATLEWTEFFGVFNAAPASSSAAALQSDDYGEAIGVSQTASQPV